MPTLHRIVTGVVVSAFAAGIAGCSAGDNVLDKGYVETSVAKQLAAQVHQPVPKVTCPHDLDAKVGATMTCTLVPQGETTKYPVTVTVDTVDTKNHTAHFSAEVGQAPSNGG